MFLWKATSLQQPFDCPLVFATPGLDLTQTIGQLSIKAVNLCFLHQWGIGLCIYRQVRAEH